MDKVRLELSTTSRDIAVGENGISISPSAKYIPRLVELFGAEERRGKTTLHHGNFEVHDADSTKPEDYLIDQQAKMFRSGLGLCLYVSQERLDIQHAVRVLSSYMSKPTKMALNALKKLTAYLAYTKDMRLRFEGAQRHSTLHDRRRRSTTTTGGQAYQLEPFSGSDWASCKVSRKSTSSGPAFLNGCCVHSHCRAQQSVSLRPELDRSSRVST